MREYFLNQQFSSNLKWSMIYPAIALLCLSVDPVICQKSDTLLNHYKIWTNDSQVDSTRVDALFKVIKGVSKINADSAFQLAEELLDYGIQKNNDDIIATGHTAKGLAFLELYKFNESIEEFHQASNTRDSLDQPKKYIDNLIHLVKAYRRSGNPDEALRIAQQAYNFSDVHNLQDLKAQSLSYIGLSHRSLGNYQDALTNFNKALELNKNLRRSLAEGWAQYHIANIYIEQGRFNKALEHIKLALPILENHNNLNAMASAYTLLARIYTNSSNYESAMMYNLKTLNLYRELHDKRGIASQYNNIGVIHKKTENYDSALHYFRESSILWNETNDLWGLGYAYGNIGVAYRTLGQYDLALENDLKALNIRTQIGNKRGMAGSSINVGDTYYRMKQYQKAISYCNRGLNLAKEAEIVRLQSRAHEVLYDIYNELGQFKTALEHFKHQDAIEDSIYTKDIVLDLQKLEYQKQFAQDSILNEKNKLEAELALQSEINKQAANKRLFMGIGSLLLILSIGLYSRLAYTRKTKKLLESKNKSIEIEKQKAQTSEKAKHQFLANMSHEIRTPMNAIKGMTDILLRRAPKQDQLDYLSAIKESSNSLLVIINDILDLSKIEAGKIDIERIPFNLLKVIDNVNNIIRFKAEEKGLQLQFEIENNFPRSLIGDPTRLHQILINLLGNAIKFTDKGVISLTLNYDQAADSRFVLAQFCVSDTGVGIGQDRIDKIFESFEQAYSDTTRKFGGTGLGLSISKKLVELQNGEIWVESNKNKGSQFYFSIPYEISQESITEVKEAANVAKNDEHLEGLKILLVEDNEFNAIVASEELQDALKNINIDIVENGLIAIEKAKLTQYDIILMDVQMPVMNGYEATRTIRSLKSPSSKIPIIAMTANVLKEEVNRCYEAGMNDFIGKPFDVDELVNKISQLVRGINSNSNSN